VSAGVRTPSIDRSVFLRRLVLAEILAPRGEGPLALRQPLRPKLEQPRETQEPEREP
jgi:hypothetical protein